MSWKRVGELTGNDQKEKRMKRNEDSLKDLWDNTKNTNIHIIGVPEDHREKRPDKMFEKNNSWKLLKAEEWNSEAQRLSYRINPKRNKPRHIIIKMEKNEHKEKTVKAARGKKSTNIRALP